MSNDNDPCLGTVGAGVRPQAQEIFGEIHTSLGQLVNDVVAGALLRSQRGVFKAKCGQVAADFADKMHADIAAMAEAVRASTSNIAGSLGGAPIAITVEAQPFIVAPGREVQWRGRSTSTRRRWRR